MSGIEGQHPRGQWVDETTDWPQRRIDERREDHGQGHVHVARGGLRLSRLDDNGDIIAEAAGPAGILVIPDSGDYDLSATFNSSGWGPLGPPMILPQRWAHQVEFPLESVEDETIELLFGGGVIPLHKRRLPAKGQE